MPKSVLGKVGFRRGIAKDRKANFLRGLIPSPVVTAVPLESSNLSSVTYIAPALTLLVSFRDGSTYRYSGVDPATYTGLLIAGSHGSYFYHNIRLNFEYERVG